METENRWWQVHRFHDTVAVCGGGVAYYLTPGQARKLAAAVKRAADECDEIPFTRSTVGTVEGVTA